MLLLLSSPEPPLVLRTEPSASMLVRAECWTCQVDNDCLEHDATTTAILKSNSNTTKNDADGSVGSNQTSRICAVDRQLCVHRGEIDHALLLDDDCPCRHDDECSSGNCDGGFLVGSCQPSAQQQQPHPEELGSIGDSCMNDEDCQSGRCDERRYLGGAFSRICREQVEIGSRCSVDRDCIGHAVCERAYLWSIFSTCQELTPIPTPSPTTPYPTPSPTGTLIEQERDPELGLVLVIIIVVMVILIAVSTFRFQRRSSSASRTGGCLFDCADCACCCCQDDPDTTLVKSRGGGDFWRKWSWGCYWDELYWQRWELRERRGLRWWRT